MPRTLLWASLGALVIGTGGADATEVYRWTDAAGQVHFADRAPPDAEATRLASIATDVPGEDHGARLDETLARIERQIDALRDLRAARLGISRAALDRYEGRAAGSTAAPPAPVAEGPVAEEDRIEPPARVYWSYPVYARPSWPAVTSDAFRPRRVGSGSGRRWHTGRAHRRGPGLERRPRPARCCGPSTANLD